MCVLRLWCKQINNNNKNYFPAGVIPSSVPMKSISHIWYLWFLLPTTMGPVSERKREIWKERKQWNWLLSTDIFDVSLKCAMCQSHEIRFFRLLWQVDRQVNECTILKEVDTVFVSWLRYFRISGPVHRLYVSFCALWEYAFIGHLHMWSAIRLNDIDMSTNLADT